MGRQCKHCQNEATELCGKAALGNWGCYADLCDSCFKKIMADKAPDNESGCVLCGYTNYSGWDKTRPRSGYEGNKLGDLEVHNTIIRNTLLGRRDRKYHA